MNASAVVATRGRHIPRLAGLDHSLAMMRAPYEFISRECRRLGTDVFQARLLLRPTICMTGREAAQLFYDPRRFKRAGAAPLRLQDSLLGIGGVQTLDDQDHVHRKRLFLSLLAPERLHGMVSLFESDLRASVERWSAMKRVVLYDELHVVLTRAVCRWAGIPLAPADVERRTRQLALMFDRAGAVGPPHWRARQARNRAEEWIGGIIEAVRVGAMEAPRDSVLDRIAWHAEQGKLLDASTAAVEVLNILRPTVAVSAYLVFLAHALHEKPECRQLLHTDTDDYATAFVHEVRRYYPFFPAVPALVRESFEWQGYRFPAGTRTLLDLYGINRDPRLWKEPEMFLPERFIGRQPDAFSLVPQGGGEHLRDHRCAGEWLTIALMKAALRFIVREIRYAVPPQDLPIDLSRLPALPRSRFVICDVRRAS